MKPELMDAPPKFEFFKYRKAGKEPSEIPAAVTDEVVNWMFAQPDDSLFIVEVKPDFTFQPVKGSFNKAKCVKCGEYVFERYVREKDSRLPRLGAIEAAPDVGFPTPGAERGHVSACRQCSGTHLFCPPLHGGAGGRVPVRAFLLVDGGAAAGGDGDGALAECHQRLVAAT